MASVVTGLLVALLVAMVSANITNTPISRDQCVCVQGTGVRVRSGPGLSHSVVTSVNTGDCFTLTGASQYANGYKWFQANINRRTLWTAGNFLNVASSSRCSSGNGASPSSCPDRVAKEYACQLLSKHNARSIALWDRHSSRKSDQAYALTNIEDACNGLPAKRSSYSCSECSSGPAPGGAVCLSRDILEYLVTLADSGYIHVNEIAGACHSCTSKHYLGKAVDIHKSSSAKAREMMRICREKGGTAINERTHVHCHIV